MEDFGDSHDRRSDNAWVSRNLLSGNFLVDPDMEEPLWHLGERSTATDGVWFARQAGQHLRCGGNMHRMKTHLFLALACVAAATSLVSCRHDSGRSVGRGSGVTGKHWVQDERLRGVMAELSRQSAHWPAGLPDDPEVRPSEDADQAFRDAARLSDGLARAARDIPRAVADREMSPDTRRGFNAEARRLRDQALQLKEAARDRKVERMQRLLDGISSSCISCHSQYRGFTGELDTTRAAAY